MLENDFEERICQHPEDTTLRKKIIKAKEKTSPRYGRFACAAHNLHLIETTATSEASLDARLKHIKAWKQDNVNDDTRDVEIQALAEAAVEKYTDRDLRVAFKTFKNSENNAGYDDDEIDVALSVFKEAKKKQLIQMYQIFWNHSDSEKVLEYILELGKAIKTAKDIVSFFNKSSTCYAAFQRIRIDNQKPKQFIHDVVIRWNSTLDLVERVMDNEPFLDKLKKENEKLSAKEKLKLKFPDLSQEQWKMLEFFKDMMWPFQWATKLLSVNKQPTCTTSYIAVQAIKNRLRFFILQEEVQADKEQLYWDNHVKAKQKSNKNIKGQIPKKTKLFTRRKHMIEICKFILNLTEERFDDSFADNLYPFPKVQIALRAVFAILATSVDSERLFSKAGTIYNAKRFNLTPKHANDLLLANDFLLTVEGIQQTEEKVKKKKDIRENKVRNSEQKKKQLLNSVRKRVDELNWSARKKRNIRKFK